MRRASGERMWIMLVLVLWRNEVAVTHVVGFTSYESCQEVVVLLRKYNKTVGGPSYSPICLSVK